MDLPCAVYVLHFHTDLFEAVQITYFFALDASDEPYIFVMRFKVPYSGCGMLMKPVLFAHNYTDPKCAIMNNSYEVVFYEKQINSHFCDFFLLILVTTYTTIMTRVTNKKKCIRIIEIALLFLTEFKNRLLNQKLSREIQTPH